MNKEEMMIKCKKCKEYRFENFGGGYPECHCKPFIIVDEDGEEHDDVYAVNDREAAIKFAEWSNIEGDYHLMGGHIDILVNGKAFRVGAEPNIHYSAEELKV